MINVFLAAISIIIILLDWIAHGIVETATIALLTSFNQPNNTLIYLLLKISEIVFIFGILKKLLNEFE